MTGAHARVAALSAVLVLAACAPVVPAPEKGPSAPVVFPQPPDQARFIYERTLYGSNDVVPEEGAEHFRRMVTGEARAGEGLAKPYAVAVFRGRIFISDSVQRFIKVFDVPNRRYYRIGENQPGRLLKPLGIDVDRGGNLYVADATAKAVMVYGPEGKFRRKIGGPQWFDRLASVSADPRGDRIYAVDVGGVQSQQHRVRVFDAASGEHLFDIGRRGKEPGEFNFPRDLAVGRGGELYVVDSGNFRVQVFGRDGKYLRSFGGVGRQFGNFSRPKEIAADAEGNLYVVDTAFGNFQIFDPEGKLLLFVGERSERDGPARYMLPSGIAVDEDGRVYMVDQWFRKVDVFRPAGLGPGQGYLGKLSAGRTPAK
ncbi:MAG: 6-bladed beta-propeller [Burkholderiales bacterium]